MAPAFANWGSWVLIVHKALAQTIAPTTESAKTISANVMLVGPELFVPSAAVHSIAQGMVPARTGNAFVIRDSLERIARGVIVPMDAPVMDSVTRVNANVWKVFFRQTARCFDAPKIVPSMGTARMEPAFVAQDTQVKIAQSRSVSITAQSEDSASLGVAFALLDSKAKIVRWPFV